MTAIAGHEFTRAGTQLSRSHAAFLSLRAESIRRQAEVIQLRTDTLARMEVSRPAPSDETRHVVWDEADLLEFAQGDIANVFGPDYGVIDTYCRRVRLPMPPYLLVSCVTRLMTRSGSRPIIIVKKMCKLSPMRLTRNC